jgi:uncharacterized protein (DUF1697 family)
MDHAPEGRIMTTYVALLHSIILGQGRRVVMTDLRAMAGKLGLQAPRTLIATGNLVFEAKEAAVAQLEAQLETAFEETFGRHVDIILRKAADWRRLMAGNPFPRESETDASRVVVRVMRKPLGGGIVGHLEPYREGGERLAVTDGDLWIYFPHGQSQSKLAAALTSRRLEEAGTLRNWNTIRRLGDMLAADRQPAIRRGCRRSSLNAPRQLG